MGTIRVNKLMYSLNLNKNDDGLTLLNSALNMDLNVNDKLHIIKESSSSLVIDDINQLATIHLQAIKEQIERAIEAKHVIAELNANLDKLNAIGINELTTGGYTISRVEQVLPSSINLQKLTNVVEVR